jgi:hypothetical protein
MVPVADPIQRGVVPPVTDPPTESGLTVTAIVLAGEGHKGGVVYLLTTLTVWLPATPPILTVICLDP